MKMLRMISETKQHVDMLLLLMPAIPPRPSSTHRSDACSSLITRGTAALTTPSQMLVAGWRQRLSAVLAAVGSHHGALRLAACRPAPSSRSIGTWETTKEVEPDAVLTSTTEQGVYTLRALLDGAEVGDVYQVPR